jgi:tetratricopeptide (TPR) repeat protein
MHNAHFQRGSLLYEQGRFVEAAAELRMQLGQNADDPLAHAMLALSLAQIDQLPEATDHAQRAIHLDPEQPFAFFALAQVMLRRNRYAEAQAAITEAIRLNPYNADYFAILASLNLRASKWLEALAAANQGLEIEPEHQLCTNLRAQALVNLGDKSAAAQTLGEALARRPDDAYTHANQGWSCLHRGDPKQAEIHFREALRLDPEMEWARAGIVESLKANNFVYRWMLAYFLWMSRLSPGVRWGLVIGAFFGSRAIGAIAQQSPLLGLVLLPVLFAYFAFVLMSWLSDSFYNLLLRLHPFGRHALSRDQIRGANVLAVCLIAVVACLVAALVVWREPLFLATLFLTILALPASAIFVCQPGWPRQTMAAITLALLAWITFVTLVGLMPPGQLPEYVHVLGGKLLDLTPYALLGSQFAAMGLSRAMPRR